MTFSDENVPRDEVETPIRELARKASRAALQEAFEEQSESAKKGKLHLPIIRSYYNLFGKIRANDRIKVYSIIRDR